MSREIRKVPKDWVHPIGANGRHIALSNGHENCVEEWETDRAKYPDLHGKELEDKIGHKPTTESRMLLGVPDSKRTHYQMYQITSEGTPISPVLESRDEVARWCADNGVSAFGGMTQSYEWWLQVCEGSAGFGLALNRVTGEVKPV